ncbi:hypothetical protein SDC9_75525 [bioreactor metagenome]|uniref:Uncharacterized protein n=1 Tax=bioreactor metagenome TaxID=1076179 RepID=A0A644YKZ8_9ZZZZ
MLRTELRGMASPRLGRSRPARPPGPRRDRWASLTVFAASLTVFSAPVGQGLLLVMPHLTACPRRAASSLLLRWRARAVPAPVPGRWPAGSRRE